MSRRDFTRVCVLTPIGRGAVAVVAVEGVAAVTAVDRYFKPANQRGLGEQALGRIVYGHWGSPDGEDLIVCRRSDESLEIHCHGGRQSSAQIIADLTKAGCQLVEADDWLGYQYVCPITAAAQLAMAQATSFRTASILLAQYRGALRRETDAVILDLDAGNATSATNRLQRLLQCAEFGLHLTDPWRVVIAGLPNVGKSSLINALVGYERAIVFDQPGTTRDVIASTTAIDGWPVELSDTAGLQEPSPTGDSHSIEVAGIALARERLQVADLVVWVLDAVEIASHGERSNWELARQQAEAVGVWLDSGQTLIVTNKIDLVRFTAEEDPQCVSTCAVNGEGIEQLLGAIANRLVPIIPPPTAPVPFTPEQVESLKSSLFAVQNEDNGTARAILCRVLESPGSAR